MSLDASRLAEAASRHRLGAVRFVEVTGSTNADAVAWALNGADHGSAVVADTQTAGRGRLGRSWESPPGANLYLSIVLRPELPIARLALVTLAAAVAVAECAGPMSQIKWPNDVLGPDGRKLAGILAEADVAGERVRHVVVGVGINVRAAPLPTATCLLDLDGAQRDRSDLAATIVRGVIDRVALLRRDASAVLDAWRARSGTLGKEVRIGDVTGVAVDLEPDGALLVVDREGNRRIIHTGDVEWIGASA